LSGRGLCDELITRPEESYRLCCVVVCDLETSRMGASYIYDISHLRVNRNLNLDLGILFFLAAALFGYAPPISDKAALNLQGCKQFLFLRLFQNPLRCILLIFMNKK